MTDWYSILNELAKLAREFDEGNEPPSTPNLPASGAAVAEVERHLGHALDPEHRSLLLACDGWPDLFTGADLFTVDDLLGRTPRLAQAVELVWAYNPAGTFPPDHPEETQGREPPPPPTETIRNADVLPIASYDSYLSIVCVGRIGRPCAGQVVHILGSSVERFDCLSGFARTQVVRLRTWIAERDRGRLS